MKVLIIEDVVQLAELTRDGLRQEGFEVDLAHSVKDARAIIDVSKPDVVVLDLGLPDGCGLEFLSELRRKRSPVPVLIVTARGGLSDKVLGLDTGADDYLVKPAVPLEIAARCRALLRRPSTFVDALLQLGNVRLDTRCRLMSVGDVQIHLPPREISVIEVLMRRPDRVVHRGEIETSVYTLDGSPGPNAIEASISRLRRVLVESDATITIHTVRGVGYLLKATKD